MKKIVAIILLLNFTSYARQWEWAEAFKTIGSTVIKIDNNGNTFALISYTDSIDEPIPVMSYDSLPRYTLIKRDKHNNFLWSKLLSCSGRSKLSITFNQDDEAILNGYFSGTFSTPDFSIISNGYADICIIKISNNGTFSLIKQLGGTGNEIGECAFNSNGYMIVTGGYIYSGTFDTLIYQGNINYDFFILFYDVSGNMLWAERAITADSSIYSMCLGSGLKTDSLNNIYVEITGNGVMENTGVVVGMTYGAYLYKFNASGTLLNQYDIGYCYPSCLPAGYEVDNTGNIYFATASESAHTSFTSKVVKKDASGNILWQKTYGAGGYATPPYRITGFYIDQRGNYYTTGISDTTIGIKEFISKGNAQTGNIQWTYHEKVDGSYITQDKDSAIYVAGEFQGKRTIEGITITSIDSTYYYYSPYVVKLTNSSLNVIRTTLYDQAIIIYPNPSSGIFIASSGKEISQIVIYDCFGEKIYSSQIKKLKHTIDLSAEPKGIYFVEILTEEKRKVKKVILE